MVANPGKLIDADALINAIRNGRANTEGKISLSVMRDIALVMDQPDASEPLRKRIKELEDALKGLHSCVRDNWPSHYMTPIMKDVEALLKGAQDA